MKIGSYAQCEQKPTSRRNQQRSDSSDDEGDWEVVRGRHSRRDGGKGKGKAQGRRGGDRRRNGSSSESDLD